MTEDEKYEQIVKLRNKINIIKEIIEDYNLDEDSEFYLHFTVFKSEMQDSVGKELSNIMINTLRQEMNKLQKLVDDLKGEN